MADKKITAWYTANPVTLDPGDIVPVSENTGATPTTGAAKVSQLMFNRYKITPSVASNNLTVALKHEDGNNASTDRPLYFKIGDTIRAVTGALSVTKNAATNWCNAGSTELATQAIDYFVYIGYNATDGITIGFSRISHANLYSDFSATTTNEKYCAISTITNAAGGDNYVNIGRFAATLSAGAGYTWTVPTFTTANLIQKPIFETRISNWQPVASATGGGSFSISTTDLAKYQIDKNWITVEIYINGTVTGTVTGIGLTAPFEALQIASTLPIGNAKVSGGLLGNAEMAAGTPDIIRHFKYDTSAISTGASVVKSFGRYEI